jgi:hypothetical protein
MCHVEEVKQVSRKHPEALEALTARPQTVYEALAKLTMPEPRTQRTAGEGGGHEETK